MKGKSKINAEIVKGQCQYCGGNDKDVPCAYPGTLRPKCLRDYRLDLESKIKINNVRYRENLIIFFISLLTLCFGVIFINMHLWIIMLLPVFYSGNRVYILKKKLVEYQKLKDTYL